MVGLARMTFLWKIQNQSKIVSMRPAQIPMPWILLHTLIMEPLPPLPCLPSALWLSLAILMGSHPSFWLWWLLTYTVFQPHLLGRTCLPSTWVSRGKDPLLGYVFISLFFALIAYNDFRNCQQTRNQIWLPHGSSDMLTRSMNPLMLNRTTSALSSVPGGLLSSQPGAFFLVANTAG